MSVYFADKRLNIVGQASTRLSGLRIVDDTKTEEIETGVATFAFDIPFENDNRLECENITWPGNYVLRHHEYEDELYTIIEQTVDTNAMTVHVYAEDAGLELLNEVALAYPDNIPQLSTAKTLTQYMTMWLADTEFEIGINEAAADATTIVPDWSGEATMAERLRDVAEKFGYEIGYSYTVSESGFRIEKKHVNIYKKRGADNGVLLRLNKEISRLGITRTVSELATALLVYGAEVGGEKLKLQVGDYSDDDITVQNLYFTDRNQAHTCLVSASALNRFGPLVNGQPQHIVKTYTYDTVDRSMLAKKAAEELKKCRDVTVNYEVDLVTLDGARLGDTVHVIDDRGEIYISARVLKIESSICNKTITATLGDYLIESSGMSASVAGAIDANAAAIADLRTTVKNPVTYASSWAAYDDAQTPTIRKCGNIVALTGAVKPTSSVTPGQNGVQIASIPARYAPAQRTLQVCQGSGARKWLLDVESNGKIYCARYGTTAVDDQLGEGTWLPFHVVWILG